jgi:hypothetical protein
MTRSTLARSAAALIGVFPLIVIALHDLQGSAYHPLSEAVSELALGRAGWLMAIAFCALATGTLFLAALLRRLDSAPRVGPALIAASGMLGYVSAFVHADGPNTTTTHGQIHQAVGIVTFVLMIAGMFALVRPFRRDAHFAALATPTLVWAAAAVGGFFLIPLSGNAYFGVAQRIFLGIILSWALTVALREAQPADCAAAWTDSLRRRRRSAATAPVTNRFAASAGMPMKSTTWWEPKPNEALDESKPASTIR